MNRVDTYLTSLASMLAATPRAALEAIEHILWDTYQRDGTILVCVGMVVAHRLRRISQVIWQNGR